MYGRKNKYKHKGLNEAMKDIRHIPWSENDCMDFA